MDVKIHKFTVIIGKSYPKLAGTLLRTSGETYSAVPTKEFFFFVPSSENNNILLFVQDGFDQLLF